MKSNLDGRKNIETPFLKVRGNCLEIENTIIQLSNISLFSTAAVTPEKFPILSVVLIVCGCSLLQNFEIPAVIALIIGIFWLIYWLVSVERVKELKRLTIITNSGSILPIVFNDEEFLAEVVSTMTEIIQDPAHAREITINIKECTFLDDSSAIGNIQQH